MGNRSGSSNENCSEDPEASNSVGINVLLALLSDVNDACRGAESDSNSDLDVFALSEECDIKCINATADPFAAVMAVDIVVYVNK